MAKSFGLMFFTLLPFLLSTCFRPSNSECSSNPKTKPGFSGMFVFGNSVMDSGNNNFIQTQFKANYHPYGIDFPSNRHPTSRFSNGKNQADRIADLLKLPLVPASSDPQSKGVRLSNGVNHASAGSGILDATGSYMGVMSLTQQIGNFEKVTVPSLEAQQGCPSSELLQNYLFLLSTGSNDFMSNFFQGRSGVSLESFTANMTSSLASQLKRLYKLGARKFAFLDIGPLGCTPMAREAMPDKACNEALNYAAFLFNEQLVPMLKSIRPQMPDFQFVVVNSFQIILEFIRNPSTGGFSDVSNSCCEVSGQSSLILCKAGGTVCSNRSSYMFFDGYHPTEALYGIVAARSYYSNSTSEAYPFNLQKLAQV